MYVREDATALQSVREGRTYYFCSRQCVDAFERPEHDRRWLLAWTVAAWLAGVLVMATMFAPALPFESGDAHTRMRARNVALWVLATPIQFLAGWRFYQGLAHAVRRRVANMDTLIAIGTSTAYGFSAAATLLPDRLGDQTYFDVSVLVIAFILLGRTLELRMKARAAAALRSLLQVQPRTALRVAGDGTDEEVPVEALQPGDVVRVRPGQRVPVDGLIREGQSALDESMLTGESVPVAKGPGDEAVGGSVSTSGLILVEVRRVGRDTTLAQIVDLVERAQTGRAPIQRLVDTVSAYFVPAVLVVAVVSFLGWWLVGGRSIGESLLPLVAVLIIACPCALGLATPAALLVAVGKGAQHGILVKETDQLEALAGVRTVVFDKTGTLTRGRHRVREVVPASGTTAEEVLRVAAAVEAGSTHPLARAIAGHAREQGIRLPSAGEFQEDPGRGVRASVAGSAILVGTRAWLSGNGVDAERLGDDRVRLENQGNTVLHVAQGGRVVGLVALEDELKPGAAEAVRALRAARVDVVLVTGDNERTAQAVASKLGISVVHAETLPAGKAAIVEGLKQRGGRVAFVGDGINDAPALAAADVGIALGGGTDVAVEAGGIVLLKDDPRDAANAHALARRAMRKIRQNLFWAFIYNVALIPVAAMGWLHPIAAGAAMGLSSVTVVGNSLLLQRYRPPLASHMEARRPPPTSASPRPRAAASPMIDPVCRMTVDPATAKYSARRGDRTVYFCSAGCRAAFEADPARFERPGVPLRMLGGHP